MTPKGWKNEIEKMLTQSWGSDINIRQSRLLSVTMANYYIFIYVIIIIA